MLRLTTGTRGGHVGGTLVTTLGQLANAEDRDLCFCRELQVDLFVPHHDLSDENSTTA